MGWAAAGAAAVGVAGAAMASSAARSAAKKLAKAMEQALEFQKQVYAETKQAAAPYKKLGETALGKFGDLLFGGTEAIRVDPAYQFGVSEGVNALERGAAARGTQLSGGQQKALLRFGEDYGLGFYGERLGQLGQGVGIGQTAVALQANQGQGAATNIGAIQTTGGTNLASLRLAQTQPWANLAGSFANWGSSYAGQNQGTQQPQQSGQAPQTIRV